MTDVDLVINCYERTYRDVLQAGFLGERIAQQEYDFAEVTVLVNNVTDSRDARERADRLVASGVATRVELVAEHFSRALTATGLKARHLGRLPHFTDCCLVAMTLSGPDWVVYWDADATLAEANDWITPTLEYMSSYPDIVVGNPNNWLGVARAEALSIDGDFAVGFGFSDVAFMARRMDLARPIYRKIAPASWRYPLAHVEPIFEQRVDAWMRRSGRKRATYLPATVRHPETVGVNYPRAGLRERVRAKAQHNIATLAGRVSSHPSMRAWPDQIHRLVE